MWTVSTITCLYLKWCRCSYTLLMWPPSPGMVTVMEFDMEKVFWGTRMMAQEYSWPQVRGFIGCVSVSHSQSLQTPLHSLSTCVQWAGLLPPVHSRWDHSLIRGRSTGFCLCVIFTCTVWWLHNHCKPRGYPYSCQSGPLLPLWAVDRVTSAFSLHVNRQGHSHLSVSSFPASMVAGSMHRRERRQGHSPPLCILSPSLHGGWQNCM